MSFGDELWKAAKKNHIDNPSTTELHEPAPKPEGERVELPRAWPVRLRFSEDEHGIVECQTMANKFGEGPRELTEYLSVAESDALISEAVAAARAEVWEEAAKELADCCNDNNELMCSGAFLEDVFLAKAKGESRG